MAPVLLPWLAWLLFPLAAVYLLGLLGNGRRRGLPPGPRPLPVIGSLHLLGNQPHRSLARLARTHGPLMSLRLGAVTTVVASSPAAAREFLQRHDTAFSNRSVPDAPGDHARNSSVWLPNAPRWRALRKIMGTELFAPHRLDALQHLRREKARDLVDHVGRLARSGEAVNVGRVAFTTSLNLVSRTIFSRDLTSLDDDGASGEFQAVVTDIMEAVGSPNVSDFFPALAAADLQGWRRHLARLFARLHRTFDEEIDARLRGREAGEPKKNDFLDLLLDAAEDGDNTARLQDRDTLRSLFTISTGYFQTTAEWWVTQSDSVSNREDYVSRSDLFAAGSDTSSSTVEWAMTELLQSPASMAKARDELATVIGSGRSVQESDISRLPYLQAVVKETFRLHPPAPLLLPRHAQVDKKIMGYTIPQGSRVFVNVWAMGRDWETWPEPEKFMPERFLGRAVDLRGGDFDLIPFGGGRRICPGMPLAIRMVHLVLASLLNHFTWRLPDEVERNGVDMAEKFGLTLTKAVPLCAIATPL
ncbi:geraniol 8-hydroxylase-like [Panicum miliaceum]|uniref:Geraniol 8-hydroxylase-like n=1 Tax=Panicum miliaceum TaxID=4540 RepID=A0A3L6TMA6_PANMI|nr:geraniol 8-hydroxylase-like [Panicum miliaceum]